MDSLAGQIRPADELIVCDDGSTDETLAILEAFAQTARFPVKIQCNPKRLGPAKNFEQAISLCGGDLIALCDQDDIWREDKLQILERVLVENPDAGYAFSDASVIDETGKHTHSSLWEQVSFDGEQRGAFCRGPADQIRVLFKGNVVTGATMALRASLKARVLPVPEFWVHDEWIALSSSVHGARGVPVAEPLISYRLHRGQAMALRRPGHLKIVWWSLWGDARPFQAEYEKCRTASGLFQGAASADLSLLQFLEAKSGHLALRAGLRGRPRLARASGVVAELVRGRYHRLSGGFWSALSDLLIPVIPARSGPVCA